MIKNNTLYFTWCVLSGFVVGLIIKITLLNAISCYCVKIEWCSVIFFFFFLNTAREACPTFGANICTTYLCAGVVNFLIGHRYSMNTVPEYTTGSKNRISILYTIIVIYLSVYCGIALPGRNPINYMKIWGMLWCVHVLDTSLFCLL